MVAMALQQDGWYLRSDIAWAKLNPMPESVTDRPTSAWEHVFLLAKQPRYWFDAEAVREPFEARLQQRLTHNHDQPLAAARRAAGVEQGNPQGGVHASRFVVQAETLEGVEAPTPRRSVQRAHDPHRGHPAHHGNGADKERWPNPSGRNVRNVWSIATQAYSGAHFATFPEELVRRALLAGCPAEVCRRCGKPRERIVEATYENPGNRTTNGPRSIEQRHETPGFEQRLERRSETLGWSDCGHGGDFRPGVVLDPFIGSGTTALVARRHGRHSVGVELNPEYARLCAQRLQQLSLLAELPT
jgi:hypothetical protein